MKEVIRTTKECLMLLKATIIYSFQQETAFVSNNWTNLVSTTMYTLMWLASIQVIYSNVDQLAGYSRDEMLVFSLFSQFMFYFVAGLLVPNVRDFIRGVNKGALDMVLTKPYPSLFYTLTRNLNLLSLLRDSVIPLIFILLTIDWSNIHTSPTSVISSLIILLCGSLITYFVIFLSALPTIIIGEGDSFVSVVFTMSLDTANAVPYEGYDQMQTLKMFLTFVIPLLLVNGLSVSVFLEKTYWLPALVWSLFALILFTIIIVFLWRRALKSYSSASS